MEGRRFPTFSLYHSNNDREWLQFYESQWVPPSGKLTIWEVLKPLAKVISQLLLRTYGEDSVGFKWDKAWSECWRPHRRRAYTWFSSYDAGIVGKAEFMAHQTLYKGAINNTNGIASLSAIADGGWASDGTYKSKLIDMYQKLNLVSSG